MKKITAVLTVLAVMAGALMFTGCGVGNLISDTYDSWYVYKKEVNVPVAGEDESSTDGILKNAQVYVRFNPTDGLDVRVCTTHTQTINFMGTGYEIETTQVTGADKHYPISAEVNVASWTIMQGTGNFIKEEAPEPSIKLDDILKGNFNLKRMLANLLLGTL